LSKIRRRPPDGFSKTDTLVLPIALLKDSIDPPGSADYDWNSYHGIGAYTRHLQDGVSVAANPGWMLEHYGVKPGGWYKSDRDGRMHKFDDRTGAKNYKNEDFYHSASRGDVHVHIHPQLLDGSDFGRYSKTTRTTLPRQFTSRFRIPTQGQPRQSLNFLPLLRRKGNPE
jgi:hypothetical protein